MSLAHPRIAALSLVLASAPVAAQDAPASRIARATPLPGTHARFLENGGRFPGEVVASLQGRNLDAFFTREGAVLALRRTQADGTVERHALRLDLVGASPASVPVLEAETPTRTHWFQGAPDAWITDVRSFDQLVTRDVWPGIDLHQDALPGSLKTTFVVHPGADPSHIALAWRGADAVCLAPSGETVVATPLGDLVDAAPIAWQVIDGTRVPVAVRTAMRGAGDPVLGLILGTYDASLPLLVDPAVVIQSSFFGGSGNEEIYAMATDVFGNLWATGWTTSSQATFPTAVGPDLTYNGGGSPFGDAIVVKFDPTGTVLLSCGYIGGLDIEFGNGIATDSAGNCYVVGHTQSRPVDGFPVLVGPHLLHDGGFEGWIAKVTASGSALVYCGYIGGNNVEDRSFAVAVDAAGAAYVAGRAGSDSTTFPAFVGPDVTHNGSTDACVAKIRPDGTGFEYLGYIGGSGFEDAVAIAVDATGRAYVAGLTSSDETTFPVSGAFDLTYAGGSDGFLARVKADGTGLDWCGYLGGVNFDMVTHFAFGSSGEIVAAGLTSSSQATFPVLGGPSLVWNGFNDAIVARISADGSTLLSSGYIGGAGTDVATRVAVDGAGRIHLAGTTNSPHTGLSAFPALNGPDGTHNGLNDAFHALVDPTGTTLLSCGYIGGSANDQGQALTLDANGRPVIGGRTHSTETTFPVLGGFDPTFNGGAVTIVGPSDAFLTRLDVDCVLPAPFGTGTPGCSGPQTLSTNTCPIIGTTGFQILCSAAPPSSLGLLMITDVADVAGSDPFGIGVLLHVDLLTSTEVNALDIFSDAASVGAITFTVPNNPAIVGNTYFAQALWAWTTCSLPPFGLSTSRGLSMLVQ